MKILKHFEELPRTRKTFIDAAKVDDAISISQDGV